MNPLQAARYRERVAVSGAKSDAADAHMLAGMVRTDSHQLRPIAGDSPQAKAVKVVTRMHKTLIWERGPFPPPRVRRGAIGCLRRERQGTYRSLGRGAEPGGIGP
ncbi:IS110 family transposase [Actinoallomurus purpureus]|nr:IS110 family transposase [Actinoallomurus purpureus]